MEVAVTRFLKNVSFLDRRQSERLCEPCVVGARDGREASTTAFCGRTAPCSNIVPLGNLAGLLVVLVRVDSGMLPEHRG